MDHFSKRKGSRDKTCACSPSGDHVCDLREEAGHHNDRYRLEQSIDGKNWLRSGVPKRCTPALLYGDESAKIADMVQFEVPAAHFARIVRE